jgi:hypothetical protein
MTSDVPRRRSSDPQTPSRPGLPGGTRGEPETGGPDGPSAGRPAHGGFSWAGERRAGESRERRRRDVEWHGPERRMGRLS